MFTGSKFNRGAHKVIFQVACCSWDPIIISCDLWKTAAAYSALLTVLKKVLFNKNFFNLRNILNLFYYAWSNWKEPKIYLKSGKFYKIKFSEKIFWVTIFLIGWGDIFWTSSQCALQTKLDIHLIFVIYERLMTSE